MSRPGPSRDGLKKLVPIWDPDRVAIERAVDELPDGLLGDYEQRLSDLDSSTPTLHELRIIGKLIKRSRIGFDVVAWPEPLRVDALLRFPAREVETEITCSVGSKYADSVREVCRKTEAHLIRRFPDWAFEVQVGNCWLDFPQSRDAKGRPCLDAARLEAQLIAELEIAIQKDGSIRPQLEDQHSGLVLDIQPSGGTRVHQVGFVLPGGTDQQQIRRTVKNKIDEQQWSGARPGVLALVLNDWPMPDLVTGGSPSIAEELFRGIECLEAIAILPAGNFVAGPTICFPTDRSRMHALDDQERNLTRRAFRFCISVDPRQAKLTLGSDFLRRVSGLPPRK